MTTKISLDKLPPELRREVFDCVFPEGHTTVSFTAFCNLATDKIDIYRLKSDDEAANSVTLAELAKFNSRLLHAIIFPLANEITKAFWRNSEVIINISDDSTRSPFQEPFHPCPTFLNHAAGNLHNLAVKIYLIRAADSHALAQSPAIYNTFFSCNQVFVIKTFAHRAAEGRMKLLSVTSRQLLGITHHVGATADLIARETWCKDFLRAAQEPTQGCALSGAAIRILLLKISSFDSMTTSNTFLTISPIIVRQWEAMDAQQTGLDLASGTFISPAGRAYRLAPPSGHTSAAQLSASTPPVAAPTSTSLQGVRE